MTDIIQKDGNKAQVLRSTAERVSKKEFNTDKLDDVLTTMKTALHDTDDGVAIAAPQVGISKRIFVVRDAVFADRGDIKEVDKAFINPELINTSQATHEINEGCLSVRHKYGKVKRHKQATVRAMNPSGSQFTLGGSGLLAQIFQHEIEHLDGILFTDKADNVHEINPKDQQHSQGQQGFADDK